MAPTLYKVSRSPPVRGVLMTIRAINLEVNLKEVDTASGDHLKPEYLKINPQHTVPTLVDGDFILWDSHAISPYLVQKYGKNDSLYPKNLEARATIDQRLHYDNGVLFPLLRELMGGIFRGERTSVDPEVVKKVQEAYQLLDKLLQGRKWIAGDSVTIADFSIVATVSTMEILVPLDKHRLLAAWYANVQKLDAYEANKEGLEQGRAFILSKMKA